MRCCERWLLRGVLVDGEPLDCRVRDGVVAELASGLMPTIDEQILNAGGGALLPGLVDHHLHLRASAAARRSVDLRGQAVSTAAIPPGAGVVRIIGAGDEPARAQLDELFADRPVRVQHRSGALWTLNTAALQLLQTAVSDEERRTGRFWRASDRLRALSTPLDGGALAELSAELAGYGVTHTTDATPDGDPDELAVDQHVLSLAARGTGPRKVVISDHAELDYAGLVRAIRSAHGSGRPVAVHTVTAASLSLLLAAFGEAGVAAGDRVEHAAVCSDAAAARLAQLGLPVITQPSLYARYRVAYLRDSEPDERELLWRYGGLVRHGVRVAVSSDAPYGDLDPWRTVAAAATALADSERVDPLTSLSSMLSDPRDPTGPCRTVRVGAPADLCVLGGALPAALTKVVAGDHNPVVATFIGGTARFLRAGLVQSAPRGR